MRMKVLLIATSITAVAASLRPRNLQANNAGDSSGLCTECTFGTSGSCIQSNGLCWSEIGVGICPGGSVACVATVDQDGEPLPSPSPAAGAPTPRPVPSGGCEHPPYVVAGYYGSWSHGRQEPYDMQIEDIDSSILTHVIYSFVAINGFMEVMPYNPTDVDDYARFISHIKSLNPCVKPIIAVGGWNAGVARFSAMAASATTRTTFINSVMVFLETYGFEGFDIDWEFPTQRGGSPNDRANLVLLAKEMREAFDKHHDENPGSVHWELSMAASFNPRLSATMYDQAELHKYMDYIGIMTYDAAGPWDNQLGQHTAMAGSDLGIINAIDVWINNGCPPEKMVLGLAAYGRSWSTFATSTGQPQPVGAPAAGGGRAGAFTSEPGYLSFYEIQMLLEEPGASRGYDPVSQCHFAQSGTTWVGYDEPEDIQVKIDFMKERGMQGVMIWSIESDDFVNGNPILSVSAQLMEPIPSQTPTVSMTASTTPAPSTSAVAGSGTIGDGGGDGGGDGDGDGGGSGDGDGDGSAANQSEDGLVLGVSQQTLLISAIPLVGVASAIGIGVLLCKRSKKETAKLKEEERRKRKEAKDLKLAAKQTWRGNQILPSPLSVASSSPRFSPRGLTSSTNLLIPQGSLRTGTLPLNPTPFKRKAGYTMQSTLSLASSIGSNSLGRSLPTPDDRPSPATTVSTSAGTPQPPTPDHSPSPATFTAQKPSVTEASRRGSKGSAQLETLTRAAVAKGFSAEQIRRVLTGKGIAQERITTTLEKIFAEQASAPPVAAAPVAAAPVAAAPVAAPTTAVPPVTVAASVPVAPPSAAAAAADPVAAAVAEAASSQLV